jgi:uncharacterized protein YrrD
VAGDGLISYLALKSGTDVVSADGQRVGAVQRVLADERAHIFGGIVIDTRRGPGGLHFVDAREVVEIREDAVVIAVAAAQVPALPEPRRTRGGSALRKRRAVD